MMRSLLFLCLFLFFALPVFGKGETLVQHGTPEQVKDMLDKGVDPNQRDAHGKSLLARAARYGNLPAIEILLQAGADPNVPDDEGCTPLFHAAQKGHTAVVRALLEAGAEPDSSGQHGSPLAVAGNPEITAALLDAGSDPNMPIPIIGISILHAELMKPDNPAVEMLLKAGADANAHGPVPFTPLSVAAANGNLEYVRLLIEYGADVNATYQHNGERGPLLDALRKDHVEVAEYLLEHGADLHQEGLFGEAIHQSASDGDIDEVKLLVRYGADVNTPNTRGETPLFLAARSGSPLVVRFLLEQGADVNIISQGDYTALHYAVMTGSRQEREQGRAGEERMETIRLLLDAGAAVNVVSIRNMTPLDCASDLKLENAVQLLLEHGAKRAEELGK